MTKRAVLAAMLTACALGSGCHRQPAAPKVAVDRAWVRMPALAGGSAAGYFTATSSTGDRLLAVTAPGARVELHESMTERGMTMMKPLAAVALPADRKVAFAPGGRHLMIFGLDAKAKPRDRIALTFHFGSAPPVTAPARLVGPGEGPPGDGD